MTYLLIVCATLLFAAACIIIFGSLLPRMESGRLARTLERISGRGGLILGCAITALSLTALLLQVHTLMPAAQDDCVDGVCEVDVQDSTSGVTTAGATGSSPTAKEEAVGEPQDFILYDLDGKQVRLSDYRGEPVYVEFWGTWCSGCLTGLPSFQRLANDYNGSGQMRVLSIVAPGMYGEMTKPYLLDWIDGQGLDFPILLDECGNVTEQFGVYAYPSSFLFNAESV